MQLENYITLITSFTAVFVSIYILKQDPKSKVYRIFALTSIISGLFWSATIAFFREATTLESALIWNKGIYIVSVIIGLLYFWFTLNFPKPHKTNIFSRIIIIGLSLFFFYSILFNNLFIVQVELNSFGNKAILGPVYVLWLFWMIYIYFYGGLMMVRDVNNLGAIEKNQFRFFTLGVVFPAFAIIPTNAILPMFGIYEHIWVGPLFTIIMNIIVAYSITRIRFVSISNIMAGIIRILMLSIFISFLYFGFYRISYIIFLEKVDLPNVLLIFGLIIGSSIAMLTFNKWVQNVFIKKVIANQVDTLEVRDKFTRETSTQLELTKLSLIITNTLSSTFNIDKTGFVIIDKDYKNIILDQYVNITALTLETIMEIYENSKEFFDHDEPIIVSELEYIVFNQKQNINTVESTRYHSLVKILKSEGIEMVFHISPRVDYKGMLFIGKKINKDAYTLEEIDLIKSLINNISLSIGRALLYTRVENFNIELSEKIADATKEITKQKDEITKSLQKERDMLDILGHELRTPLGIAKNASIFLSDLVNQDKLTKEKAEKYSGMIIENLKRESRLLETILADTKIDNNKLGLIFEEVDLIDVAKDALEGFNKKAKEKHLEIQLDLPEKSSIFADRTRIQQVIDNLIDNAIKYTEEGWVKISIDNGEKTSKIMVEDSGIGIPDEDIEKLGQKFYRVNNYLTSDNPSGTEMQIVRPGGTGLGLYVTFNLVRLMKGTIKVTSKENVGTKFTIEMPTYTGQKTEIYNNTNPSQKFRALKKAKDLEKSEV